MPNHILHVKHESYSKYEYYKKRYKTQCPIDHAAMEAWHHRKERKFNLHQLRVITRKLMM